MKNLSHAHTPHELKEAKALMLKVLKQIVWAMYVMEQKGIVHSQMEGHNILIDLGKDPDLIKNVAQVSSRTNFIVKIGF